MGSGGDRWLDRGECPYHPLACGSCLSWPCGWTGPEPGAIQVLCYAASLCKRLFSLDISILQVETPEAPCPCPPVPCFPVNGTSVCLVGILQHVVTLSCALSLLHVLTCELFHVPACCGDLSCSCGSLVYVYVSGVERKKYPLDSCAENASGHFCVCNLLYLISIIML